MARAIMATFASLLIAIVVAAASAATSPPRSTTDRTNTVVRYQGLSAPESVLYDAGTDRYLVSNVNGDALAKDNNGFISVLSPAGRVIARKWIEGGKNGITLDAPKGMAVANGVLFVADIAVVRRFDLASGEPRGDIPVPGSTFLNDLAAGPDGKIYLSDSGPPTGNFDGSGTEAVYVIEGGHARVLAKGKELGRPNGVAWTDKGVVVCPFGANEIYRLDETGAKRDVTKLPAGGLAGLVRLHGDSFLVTSWQSSAIFRGQLGGEFRVAFAEQKAPSDIGYDSKRNRLLVPHYTEGTVEVLRLK